MKIIRPIQRVIDSFEALPGIGPKSAARLAYYLLNVPQERLERFAEAFSKLKKDTKLCELCFNVGEEQFCVICQDQYRDRSVLCVVETALDLVAIEKSESFKGVYHVLGGSINPMAGIGPGELRLSPLFARLKLGEVKELIVATNPNLEGEATAMYIREKVIEFGMQDMVRVSRIGRGLSTGSDIEFVDGQTLMKALESRKEM